MKSKLFQFWKENKALLLFLMLMFTFRSAVADWNDVPTGSMQPTIQIGDRIFVNKMAYDVRLPFTHLSLIKLADPEHGDIVVFDSAESDKRLVKRLVGIPGDTVAMKDNVLYINGEKLSYFDLEATEKIENLLGVKHFIRVKPSGGRRSNFGPVKVPEDQYLVLGDDRDNSADSRVIGFVPRQEIIGRARHVVMSFNYDNYYIPRSDRFFQTL